MKFYRIFQSLARVAFLLLISNIALANIVITFSPGLAFENNGNTQTLLIQTTPQSISNEYVANNDWHTDFMTQLFVGTDVFNNDQYDLQVGARVGYVNNTKLSGIVRQFALPDFDTLNYQYNVSSYTAMGDVKLFYLMSQKWRPYIDASLGYANNVAADYEETPRVTGAVPMAAFGSNGTSNFAYGLGLGVMMQLTNLFSLGIGYQFEDLGRAQLGLSATQTSTETPSVQHIYLNEALVNLSWIM